MSTLDTMNRVLKDSYGRYMALAVIDDRSGLAKLCQRDRARHLARKYRRRSRWHIAKRRRAAYAGLAKKWTAIANEAHEAVEKHKPTPGKSLIAEWAFP